MIEAIRLTEEFTEIKEVIEIVKFQFTEYPDTGGALYVEVKKNARSQPFFKVYPFAIWMNSNAMNPLIIEAHLFFCVYKLRMKVVGCNNNGVLMLHYNR